MYGILISNDYLSKYTHNKKIELRLKSLKAQIYAMLNMELGSRNIPDLT